MLSASALTCVLVLVFIGLHLGLGTEMFGEIRTYIALRREIRNEYIGDYEGKDVSEAALSAAVLALGDQWSYYLTPEEYREYISSSNNQYSGLGISVRKDEQTGGLFITNVFPGSPAEKAGISAGDIITVIDGTDVSPLALGEATALIDGQFGKSVRLTVRGEDGAARDVEVEYALIETHPVSYKLIDGDVGYIQIKNFEGSTADEFVAAADALVQEGAASFVFDVRNNGGGKVSELTRMLDYLLPACDIFVAVDKSGGEDVIVSGPENVKLPCVVLVNAYSFSAAEYFAACLREYEYASVVGQQTTGKNRSQITLELPDGGALHISSGEYLTPNRVSLTEQDGLTPDIEITLSDEDNVLLFGGQLDASKDTQLLKALDILKQS